MTEQAFRASMKEMQELKEKISRAVQGITGLRMNIELVSPTRWSALPARPAA